MNIINLLTEIGKFNLFKSLFYAFTFWKIKLTRKKLL